MADKLRELARRFRAARADGRIRLPRLPYRRESAGPVLCTTIYLNEPAGPLSCQKRPSITGRIKQCLQAIDQWLEVPDLARKVVIKGGKIAWTGATAVGVCRIGYFELKRLREQDDSQPVMDGYEHARANVLSYIQGQPCQDPSTTFVQSVKNLCNPFYIYTEPANTELAEKPVDKSTGAREERPAAKAEDKVQHLRRNADKDKDKDKDKSSASDKDKDKDKENPQSKSSASGQGPEAAPKK